MWESRKVASAPNPEENKVQKFAPENYFNLPMTILFSTGMYPISSKHSFVVRLLYAIYFWILYFLTVILNPISTAIDLLYQTNLDDLTNNTSYFINLIIATFKVTLFMIKRKDLLRLVQTIQGGIFRHRDCCQRFSANRLIRQTVRTSQAMYFIFLLCVSATITNSILNATTEGPELQEISDLNGTDFAETGQGNRGLPFHGWYPFSVQTSPNYEFAFMYQIATLLVVSQMIMSLDILVYSIMMQIKVQFRILSHNLRYIKSHAIERQRNVPESEATYRLTKTIESDLEGHIAHHRAIIQVTKDLESVFTYQLLIQFICSLLAIGLLMWQVSTTPVFSAKFGTSISYLGAATFQLFTYCWFGNELMLEGLSVAEAAWDSKWNEISSRRYCRAVGMIMNRSQRTVTIMAGGFIGLTLETFMTISQAAYSCFAVLKNLDS